MPSAETGFDRIVSRVQNYFIDVWLLPLIVTLTQDNFAQQVLQSPVPVLVDFWAECAARAK